MEYTLTSITPRDKRAWEQMEALLDREGIRRDANLEETCAVFDEAFQLVATGSCFGNTLRCFAVDRDHQGEGLMNRMVNYLAEHLAERGIFHLFVYTKCQSAKFFRDLGFREIARVEGTLSFLENRPRGFEEFLGSLSATRLEGKCAAIVMNANPFTRGHRYLVERAAAENDWVHLFVLSEDRSLFPFAVRWKLVREGVADLPNVICHPSGPYLISAATFPSYFLPDREAVIRGHAQLDLALFRKIAASLGITARYVGQEPSSRVTGLYNQVMAQELPKSGIACVELPRLEGRFGPVSASTLRQAIHDGNMEAAREMVPETTWQFLSSPQGEPIRKAIREKDTVIHY